jgi:hypothetical protein
MSGAKLQSHKYSSKIVSRRLGTQNLCESTKEIQAYTYTNALGMNRVHVSGTISKCECEQRRKT